MSRPTLLALACALSLATACGGEPLDEQSTAESAVIVVDRCDADQDGFRAKTCGGLDCDDHDDQVYPGADPPSPLLVTKDYDCNGIVAADETNDNNCQTASCKKL